MDLTAARTLATSLMDEHGITELGWRFDFDRAERRLGCCHYRTRQITLSRAYVLAADEPSVRDTILHEIAHVLAGPRARHGWEWKVQALKIGASTETCGENPHWDAKQRSLREDALAQARSFPDDGSPIDAFRTGDRVVLTAGSSEQRGKVLVVVRPTTRGYYRAIDPATNRSWRIHQSQVRPHFETENTPTERALAGAGVR